MKYTNKLAINIGLLAVLGVSLIAFLKVAEEVWTHESVIIWDQKIANWVYALRTPILNKIMLFITSLANPATILILTILLVAILFFIKQKKYIVTIIATVGTSYIFAEIIKLAFARPRPSTSHALIIESSYSFPSGHSLIAITFYGLFVIYLWRTLHSTALKVLSLCVGIVLILAIGLSRIYLGVHWPSDVLASYCIGMGWLSIILLCIENQEKITGILKKYIHLG